MQQRSEEKSQGHKGEKRQLWVRHRGGKLQDWCRGKSLVWDGAAEQEQNQAVARGEVWYNSQKQEYKK